MTDPRFRLLAMRALAASMRGTDATREQMRPLAEAVLAFHQSENHTPAERLLIDAAEIYEGKGPGGGTCALLGLAVKFASEDWAASAAPGTPEAQPSHYYTEPADDTLEKWRNRSGQSVAPSLRQRTSMAAELRAREACFRECLIDLESGAVSPCDSIFECEGWVPFLELSSPEGRPQCDQCQNWQELDADLGGVLMGHCPVRNGPTGEDDYCLSFSRKGQS